MATLMARHSTCHRTRDTKPYAGAPSASTRWCPNNPAAAQSRTAKFSTSRLLSSRANIENGAHALSAHKAGCFNCRSHKVVCKAANLIECTEEDFVMLGLAHCFVQDDQDKLQDKFVIEPVTAGTFESMENGAVTSYKALVGVTLGEALEQNKDALPVEFQEGEFSADYEFRTQCATRTWNRPHPQEVLLPSITMREARCDYNYSVANHKRILDFENVVNDSDNVKQDMSIDVYGRSEDADDLNSEIERLSNV